MNGKNRRNIVYNKKKKVLDISKTIDMLFFFAKYSPSTLTSTSSNRPLGWLIIREFGIWTAPGNPFKETLKKVF